MGKSVNIIYFGQDIRIVHGKLFDDGSNFGQLLAGLLEVTHLGLEVRCRFIDDIVCFFTVLQDVGGISLGLLDGFGHFRHVHLDDLRGRLHLLGQLTNLGGDNGKPFSAPARPFSFNGSVQ